LEDFSFNIFATTKASDFKFGTQLGFAKAHHKVTLREKRGGGLALKKLPNILGYPFNIFATAETSNFKFSMRLGFAKAHHKTTPEGKSGRGLGLGKLGNIWGSPIVFLQRPRRPLSVSGASCLL